MTTYDPSTALSQAARIKSAFSRTVVQCVVLMTTMAIRRPDILCCARMFESAVTRTWKRAPSAASKSLPFEIPAQPISGTVETSWSVRSDFKPAGAFSSRRMRIDQLGKGDYAARGFQRKARIDLRRDLLGRKAVLSIVHDRLGGNPGPAHDESPRHHVRVTLYVRRFAPIDHELSLAGSRRFWSRLIAIW